ncbi:MAG TPA: ABC transporter permease subunit [Pseudonocardiaceae bacterium]|nr:ABC transporter permease subunit [Pseudonocardiaceae bacterium]
MTEALHAEWTKLRTLAGTGRLLAGLVVLTVALSALAASSVTCDGVGCAQDPAKVSLTGVEFGQALAMVLGVLAIGGEYGVGMIRVTLAATPRRFDVLAAKAVVVSGLVFVAGTVAVLVAVLVGRFVLPGNGFTAAHGYRALSLADGPVLRAAVGSVLYLVLIGLLSLGVATAVRDSAAAIGIVLGLVYLFPIVASVVADRDWYRHLEQIGPMTAGLAVQVTVDVAHQPVAPWIGLGVLAAWTAAALLAGGLVLRLRDA